MAKQEQWLGENSPYRYHKSKRSQFAKTDCCGQQPRQDGSRILHHNPETDCMDWFSLYRCPACGRYYIGLDDKWKWIENPLQYERQAEDCNLSGDMLP